MAFNSKAFGKKMKCKAGRKGMPKPEEEAEMEGMPAMGKGKKPKLKMRKMPMKAPWQ